MSEIDKIEEKVKKYFEQDEQTLKSLFNQIFAYICLIEFNKSDLYPLSKIVTYEQLKSICTYYNGDEIKTPTIKELNDCYFLTMCYFLKEELNWDWNKIKNFLDIKDDDEFFSSISIGKRILNLKSSFKKDIKYLVENTDKSNLSELIEEFKTWKTTKKT